MTFRKSGVAAALLTAGLLCAGDAFSMSGHAFLDFAGATISFTPISSGASYSIDQASASGLVSTRAEAGSPLETAVGSANFLGTGVTPTTMLRDIQSTSTISVGSASAAVLPKSDLTISADGLLVASAGRTSELVRASASGSVDFTVTGTGIFYITVPSVVSLDTSTITGTTAKSGDAYAKITFSYQPEVTGGSGASGSGESILSFSSTETINESGQQLLGFGFLNTGGTVRGTITAQAFVRLQASPVAVPEPETYAMFLAGLGLLGAMAWRRQRA